MHDMKRGRIQVKLSFFNLFICLLLSLIFPPVSLFLSLSSTYLATLSSPPPFFNSSLILPLKNIHPHPHPQVSLYRSAERAEQTYRYRKLCLTSWCLRARYIHTYIERERGRESEIEDLDQRRKDSERRWATTTWMGSSSETRHTPRFLSVGWHGRLRKKPWRSTLNSSVKSWKLLSSPIRPPADQKAMALYIYIHPFLLLLTLIFIIIVLLVVVNTTIYLYLPRKSIMLIDTNIFSIEYILLNCIDTMNYYPYNIRYNQQFRVFLLLLL